MANEAHVEQLMKGVEAWNAWREDNPEVDPDLAGAQLHGQKLEASDLSSVNFSGAMLDGADLREAKLGDANLQETSLRDADLTGADLGGAILRQANLADVRLTGANLREAHLEGANLRGANLDGADLRETGLAGADLWNASLDGTKLREANLTGADLGDANLSGASLGNAILTGANITGSTVSPGTDLASAWFGEEHDVDLDGADTVILTSRDPRSWLASLVDGFVPVLRLPPAFPTWSHLRAVGSTPLQGVACALLAGALLTANGIGWLNSDGVRPMECVALGDSLQNVASCVTYPIPIPDWAGRIMLSGLLLALGAILFTARCPSIVQTYPETVWANSLKRSVLTYRVASIRRFSARLSTCALVTAGGVIAIWVLGEQILSALRQG
jgi:uncharacterized protein YjbI with pentapeptide repeats